MAPLQPGTCPWCRASVLWLPMKGRAGLVSLDALEHPTGDIGIQKCLMSNTDAIAVRVTTKAHYREHLPMCKRYPPAQHTNPRRKSR